MLELKKENITLNHQQEETSKEEKMRHKKSLKG